ncbi:MAG: hypothetical protein WCI51_23475, partial [Lentisphaerota bacterium]
FLYAIFSSSLTTPQMLGNLNLKLFFYVFRSPGCDAKKYLIMENRGHTLYALNAGINLEKR